MTGANPFGSDTDPMSLLHAVLEKDPIHPQIASGSIDLDLSAILLKALRKEPHARHLSVDELRQDIEYYLQGRPVAARDRNAVYVLSKFLRRHAAVAVVTLAIAVSLLVAVINWFEARRARFDLDLPIKSATDISDSFNRSFRPDIPSVALATLRTGDILIAEARRFGMNRSASRSARATAAIWPPLVGMRAFNRLSGPDANSCAGCHNAPFGIAGGSGDFVTSVFTLGQRFDFLTFDPSDDVPTRGSRDEAGKSLTVQNFADLRMTTGLFGAGYIEMLAQQVTAELQAIRDSMALGETRELCAKGISFGKLTRRKDGLWDVTKVQGLPPWRSPARPRSNRRPSWCGRGTNREVWSRCVSSLTTHSINIMASKRSSASAMEPILMATESRMR